MGRPRRPDRAVDDPGGGTVSKATRKMPPPRDGSLVVTWSDGSGASWEITDSYADALFETVAADLGPPTDIIKPRPRPL